jgi:DNA replication protein DnaC
MKPIKINSDLLKDANIPKRFWKLGRDTYFGDAKALKRVEHYVKNFDEAHEKGVGLLFVGPSQSCKTFLASYVLKCLLAVGLQVAYYSLDELFELYISGDSAGDNFLSKFREVNCVVIDNIGVSDKDKRGRRNALERVISFRSDNGLPYIICTDLDDHKSIRENWGEKIAHCLVNDLVEVECSDCSTIVQGKRTQAKLKFMEE